MMPCPYGEYPERAHAFAPFAADMAGESRTVVAIFCQLCGEIRPVEITQHVNEDSPEWKLNVERLRERVGE